MPDMARYLATVLGAAALGAALLGAASSAKAGIEVQPIPFCQYPNTVVLGLITNKLGEEGTRYTWIYGTAPVGSNRIGKIDQDTYTTDENGKFKDVIKNRLTRNEASPFVVGTLDAMLADKIDDFVRNKKECMPTS